MPQDILRIALKNLGQCAKRIAQNAPVPIPPDHAELLIGVGTSADWIAWASRLRSLDFKTSIKRGSPRARSYLESTRYTYAWTAANALFARDHVLRHVAPKALPKGELQRFRLIHSIAALPSVDEAAYLTRLQHTLSLVRQPDAFPWAPLTSVRIIDLIYHKYTPDLYKGKGDSARAIQGVVLGGKPITSLDLPVLLYSTRNWTVHGALLDSSFRGDPQQFQLYMTTCTMALANILARFATNLQGKI